MFVLHSVYKVGLPTTYFKPLHLEKKANMQINTKSGKTLHRVPLHQQHNHFTFYMRFTYIVTYVSIYFH